jgi:hypothetical protein
MSFNRIGHWLAMSARTVWTRWERRKEKNVDDDAGKVYASRSAVGMFQLIFDENERRRQIETDSPPGSGFSLRALVAFTPVARLTLTKLFAIFLHKTDVFLR